LDDLQERREQIDMLVDWQKGLTNVDDHATERLSDFWSDLAPGWALNEKGRKELRSTIRKFGIDATMTAMRISSDQYVVLEGDPPKATQSSFEKAWNYVARIASVREREKTKPYLSKLLWIRGIARSNCPYYFPDRDGLKMIEDAYLSGISLDDLERCAKACRNWTTWESAMASLEVTETR
jgi:hypothetical protein